MARDTRLSPLGSIVLTNLRRLSSEELKTLNEIYSRAKCTAARVNLRDISPMIGDAQSSRGRKRVDYKGTSGSHRGIGHPRLSKRRDSFSGRSCSPLRPIRDTRDKSTDRSRKAVPGPLHQAKDELEAPSSETKTNGPGGPTTPGNIGEKSLDEKDPSLVSKTLPDFQLITDMSRRTMRRRQSRQICLLMRNASRRSPRPIPIPQECPFLYLMTLLNLQT